MPKTLFVIDLAFLKYAMKWIEPLKFDHSQVLSFTRENRCRFLRKSWVLLKLVLSKAKQLFILYLAENTHQPCVGLREWVAESSLQELLDNRYLDSHEISCIHNSRSPMD